LLRAYIYLAAAGVIWLIEGFLFSHYLAFAPWQTALLALIYLGLYAVALHFFLASLRNHADTGDLSPWRAVSLAPMLVVLLGSFASLPLILLVAILGKLF
jgi:hypothetical protein